MRVFSCAGEDWHSAGLAAGNGVDEWIMVLVGALFWAIFFEGR